MQSGLRPDIQAVLFRAIAIKKPVRRRWAILLRWASIAKLATGVSKTDLTILICLDHMEIQP